MNSRQLQQQISSVSTIQNTRGETNPVTRDAESIERDTASSSRARRVATLLRHRDCNLRNPSMVRKKRLRSSTIRKKLHTRIAASCSVHHNSSKQINKPSQDNTPPFSVRVCDENSHSQENGGDLSSTFISQDRGHDSPGFVGRLCEQWAWTFVPSGEHELSGWPPGVVTMAHLSSGI